MSGGSARPHGEAFLSESQSVVEWCPRKDLSFIKDHFPGQPIVPAFYQLSYIRTLVSSWVGVPPTSIAFRSVKFLAPLKPDTRVSVSVESGRKGGKTSGLFSVALEVEGLVITRGEFSLS